MSEASTAAEHDHDHPNYTMIWVTLMVLMGLQFVLKLIIPSYALFVGVIFVVATIKTVLVALNFMHMKFEKLVIFLMALFPFFFVILFFSVIVFDIPSPLS